MSPRFVVSACLAGERCRYDGGSNACPEVLQLLAAGLALPLCPEKLAGLPVPRPPCELRSGQLISHVISQDGRDLTEAFTHGVAEAMRLALQSGCSAAILKARSPSCGPDSVYDGSFSKKLVPGQGLWAAELSKAGFTLFSEERLPAGWDG